MFFCHQYKEGGVFTVCVDFLFLPDFINEQFQEALGHCITLSHSIIDIDATWIAEE